MLDRWEVGCSMSRLVLVLSLVLAACGSSTSTSTSASVACDPLGARCADAKLGCYPVLDGTRAECDAPGSVAVGGACTAQLGRPPECVEGSICLSMAAAGTKCVQYCNTDGGAPSCAQGLCEVTFGVSFGVCL